MCNGGFFVSCFLRLCLLLSLQGKPLVLWKASSLFLQSFSYKLLEVFASKVGGQDVSVFVNDNGVGNGLHTVYFCHLAVPAPKF